MGSNFQPVLNTTVPKVAVMTTIFHCRTHCKELSYFFGGNKETGLELKRELFGIDILKFFLILGKVLVCNRVPIKLWSLCHGYLTGCVRNDHSDFLHGRKDSLNPSGGCNWM